MVFWWSNEFMVLITLFLWDYLSNHTYVVSCISSCSRSKRNLWHKLHILQNWYKLILNYFNSSYDKYSCLPFTLFRFLKRTFLRKSEIWAEIFLWGQKNKNKNKIVHVKHSAWKKCFVENVISTEEHFQQKISNSPLIIMNEV